MKQFNNEKSFTLIEILVSIFIIILMSGIIFANYRQGGQQFALQRSANKLAQDIRRAQEMTISAQKHNGIIPPGGYGINLDTNQSTEEYILFANQGAGCVYSVAEDDVIDKGNFEREVKISQLLKDGSPSSVLTICFLPPYGRTAGNTNYLIYLEDEGKYKLIEVNSVGRISVESGTPACFCQWKALGCHDDSDPPSCPADNPGQHYYWDYCCYSYQCSPLNCCQSLPEGCPAPLDYCACELGGIIK